jgi:hypothetical protein
VDAREDGVFGLGSVAHVERRDLVDTEVSVQPMIGTWNPLPDAEATEKYFRRSAKSATEGLVDSYSMIEHSVDELLVEPVNEPHWSEPKVLYQAKQNPVTPMEVGADDRATLVDLAAEKQKRLNVVLVDYKDGHEEIAQYAMERIEAWYASLDKFEIDLGVVYDDALDLCLKKHKDYGPKNIALSPGGPLNGLRVRMWDKIARINHLIDSGAEPSNESLRDSFVDLLNYSAIAIMTIDGNWPSE